MTLTPQAIKGYKRNDFGLARGGGASTTNESQVIFASLCGNCRVELQERAFAVTAGNRSSGNAVLISLTPTTLAWARQPLRLGQSHYGGISPYGILFHKSDAKRHILQHWCARCFVERA